MDSPSFCFGLFIGRLFLHTLCRERAHAIHAILFPFDLVFIIS